MFDASAVARLLSGTTAGWTLVALVAVALIRVWPLVKAKVIEARANEATIADGQWKRLLEWIERLEERVAALETEIENCHRERDEARGEAIKWKSIAEGEGTVRATAAIIAANERLAEKGRKGGE